MTISRPSSFLSNFMSILLLVHVPAVTAPFVPARLRTSHGAPFSSSASVVPRLTRSPRGRATNSIGNKEVSARTLASVASSPRSQLPERSDGLCLCEAQPKVKPLHSTLYFGPTARHRDHHHISTTRPSNHSVGAQSAGASCLELGTAGPWFCISGSTSLSPLPSNRIDSLRIATTSEDQRRAIQSQPALPCPAPYCPPRVLAPDPVLASPSLSTDRQQRESWYTRSEHLDCSPRSSVGSQSHDPASYPCPSSISASLAENSPCPVKRRPLTWVLSTV